MKKGMSSIMKPPRSACAYRGSEVGVEGRGSGNPGLDLVGRAQLLD